MMQKIFLTSDWHFDHHKILEFCNRPFKDVKEMNEAILDGINSTVGERDILYCLGDLGWWNLIEQAIPFFRKIKCQNIRLIKGNHDDIDIISLLPKIFPNKVEFLGHHYEFKMNKVLFVLNHYAMSVWNRSHHGTSFQAYGHSHETHEWIRKKNQADVGVDCFNYKPVTLKEFTDRASSDCRPKINDIAKNRNVTIEHLYQMSGVNYAIHQTGSKTTPG